MEIIENLIPPLVAIILSVIALICSTRMQRKVSSKEFELSENLKSDILQFVSTLQSIKRKLELGQNLPFQVSFEEEQLVLAKLQTSPGFLLIQNSIKNEDDILWFKVYCMMLACSISEIAPRNIHLYASRILKIISKIEIEKESSTNIQQLIKIFCKQDERDTEPFDTELNDFIDFLIEKGIKDSDVKMFSALTRGADVLEEAFREGANRKCTDKMIIERYPKEYEEFIKMSKNK